MELPQQCGKIQRIVKKDGSVFWYFTWSEYGFDCYGYGLYTADVKWYHKLAYYLGVRFVNWGPRPSNKKLKELEKLLRNK